MDHETCIRPVNRTKEDKVSSEKLSNNTYQFLTNFYCFANEIMAIHPTLFFLTVLSDQINLIK